jgi:HEAT repeat protein
MKTCSYTARGFHKSKQIIMRNYSQLLFFIIIMFCFSLQGSVLAQHETSGIRVPGEAADKHPEQINAEGNAHAVDSPENPSVPVDISVRELVAELSDSDPGKRINAARELGRIGERAIPSVPNLIQLLGDTTSVTLHTDSPPALPTSPAQEAMTALVQLGKPAVIPVISALHDEKADVRKNAAKALGYMNDPRAVDPLINALGDSDTNVRKTAIESLGKLGNPRAVGPILASLKDRKTIIQNAAFDALRILMTALKERRDTETLGMVLRYPELGVRISALESLGDIPTSQSAEKLIPLLDDPDNRIRSSAISALKKIGSPAAEQLISALKSDDIGTRIITAMILGEIGDKRAVEPLTEALTFHSETLPLDAAKLRAEAATALGKIRDSRAIQPLIAALKDENPPVRERAGWALKEIGPEIVEPLTKVLMDNYPETQISAARILGDLKDPRSVEPLIQALVLDSGQDTSWLFRVEAAKALGKIKDPRAVETLNMLLGDRVSQVRDMAEWAIKEISGTGPEKKKDSWWKNILN